MSLLSRRHDASRSRRSPSHSRWPRFGFAFCLDFDEGLGHALKAESVELIERWMIEQMRLS
jgi:hypothetical protein